MYAQANLVRGQAACVLTSRSLPSRPVPLCVQGHYRQECCVPTRTSTTWIDRGLIPQTRVTRLFAVRRETRTVGVKVGVQVRCAAAANADGFERPPASKEQAFEQVRVPVPQ